MRWLSPVFKAYKVDIAFSGHVHNYQRSFPLTLLPKNQPDGEATDPKGETAGDWKLDKEFGDGASAPPISVINIVSGAGGAELHNSEQQDDTANWQPFTGKFFSQQHSLSVVDIDGKVFLIKQISDKGVGWTRSASPNRRRCSKSECELDLHSRRLLLAFSEKPFMLGSPTIWLDRAKRGDVMLPSIWPELLWFSRFLTDMEIIGP